MAEASLSLPWGREKLRIGLPPGWRVKAVLEPAAAEVAADPAAEVRRSLREPIGCPPIAGLQRKGTRTAIVIDDSTRPTPVSLILPAVLEELAAAGIRMQDVTLVTALGVHRPMTEEELSARAGSLEGLRWINHNASDPAQLSFLGTTARGTPVEVHRAVAEADLVVSIGCIEPHLIASFGGGYKNLVPGVASQRTIGHNHALNSHPRTFNMVGQPTEENPMRLDLEEAARMLPMPIFIVNAVLTAGRQVVRVVSGDPVAAHRSGAAISAAMCGVPVEGPADIVITDSHPMDRDLRQGTKAIANTIRAVRHGGVQIVFMRAEEGLGVFGLAQRRMPLGRAGLKALSPLLLALLPRLRLGDMPDDERFYLYFALQALRRCTIIVVAPTIPVALRAGLPFALFADSPSEAVALAGRLAGPSPSVLVFPYGGITYPILGGSAAPA